MRDLATVIVAYGVLQALWFCLAAPTVWILGG